jgi:hypothetical protein
LVTSSPRKTTISISDGSVPIKPFAGFIAAGSRIAADQRIAIAHGKSIGFTGTIERSQGKPEIEFTFMVGPKRRFELAAINYILRLRSAEKKSAASRCPVHLAYWNRFTKKKLAFKRLSRLHTSNFRSGI